MDNLILLAMLNDQIAAIECQLADKYGEDFAEQLAAGPDRGQKAYTLQTLPRDRSRRQRAGRTGRRSRLFTARRDCGKGRGQREAGTTVPLRCAIRGGRQSAVAHWRWTGSLLTQDAVA